jgi:hypothetical protein
VLVPVMIMAMPVIAKPVSDAPDAVGGVLLETGPLSRDYCGQSL